MRVGKATRRGASCCTLCSTRKPVGRVFFVRVLHRPARPAPGSAERNPAIYLPARATLNAQSTRHGARPGPTLAPWCTGRGPRMPRSREREEKPAGEGEKLGHPPKRCTRVFHTDILVHEHTASAYYSSTTHQRFCVTNYISYPTQ